MVYQLKSISKIYVTVLIAKALVPKIKRLKIVVVAMAKAWKFRNYKHQWVSCKSNKPARNAKAKDAR